MATTTITIGLDLGDRRHAACILDAEGGITAEELIPNTHECLEALSQRYPGAVIAMETGTHCSTYRPRRGRACVSPSAALRAALAVRPSARYVPVDLAIV